MTIDIPGKRIFVQRDVRETPAATATATSVGLTDPHYLTLQTDADLTNERVLTAGEGIDFTDNGAGGTLVINGESATTTGNKGICSFDSTDFSVTAGAVNLADTVVMSVDGDSGTATPSLNNLDILGGTGITTAGATNDITITTDDSAIVHDNLSGFEANEHIDWTADQGATNIHAGNYTDTNTTYTAGEGIDLTGTVFSAEDASTTNKGIIEVATEDEVQTGTDTARAVVPDTLQSVLSPIGSVIAWLKSYTNTPQTLPTGWVECDGSVLSDADSVYNGQTLPDLNGGEFLRGDTTSGGTGGTASSVHEHDSPFGANGTDLAFNDAGAHGTGSSIVTDRYITTSARADEMAAFETSVEGSATGNLPPYYNVVWIMRIK